MSDLPLAQDSDREPNSMSASKEIQKAIDQLMYNQLYAPDYPAEDKTTLDREESRILVWLDYVITSTRREDVGDWLRLGRSELEKAFEQLRGGDRKNAVKSFEFSIQYLRNAVARKPHKIDFIGKSGRVIIVPPPSIEEK